MLDPEQTRLRDWYDRFFIRLFHADARPRTIEAYRETIQHWEKLTTNPALARIDQLCLAEFRAALPGSAGNQAKHCRHLNAILAKLGPPGPRNRDALNILPTVPWARPPRTMHKTHTIPSDAHITFFMQNASYDLQLFLVTAALTGARQTAVRMLRPTAIDKAGQIIRYDPDNDKRRVERLKPIPSILIDWWQACGHLHYRWQIQRSSFNRRWKRTATRAATLDVTPHNLKRWWAARLVRHGASSWAVRYALDHAQRDVTGIHYLEPFDELAGLVEKIPLPAIFYEVPSDAQIRTREKLSNRWNHATHITRRTNPRETPL